MEMSRLQSQLSIINIEPTGVARARLRKKLDLTGTDTNLVSYLMELEHTISVIRKYNT